jgi:pimeloyl-ACP methyl ester carboxylesterase
LEAVVGSEVITSENFKIFHHPADEKKFPETVVLVHHMWGNRNSTWRHYRLLNEMGYDCISFDLLMGSRHKDKATYHPYIAKYIYRGVFYLWHKQITSILDEIEGDKIVYAFSGPSLSAFWACGKRTDIKKIICDGGPFKRIYHNTKNFFRYEVGITLPILNPLASFFGTSIWGVGPLDKLDRVLKAWDPKVPILSIRGIKDNIVHIDSMREVFTDHTHLDLSVLELPDGKHLDGLREFPDEYKASLEKFLSH